MLTAHERQKYTDIISQPTPLRQAFAARTVPEWYSAFAHRATRREMYIPTGFGDVRCVISTARDRVKNCPLHINLHGGGFYFPQNSDDDMYCAHVASRIQGIVIDVDYALSQNAPYPAALEQCCAAARWAFENAEELGCHPGRISIGGHSAGANLAAAVTMKLAEEYRFCLQILDYAALKLEAYFDPQAQDPGKEGVPAQRMAAFAALYTDGDTSLESCPFVSPFMAPDELLMKMPNTLVISAGKCSMRFENEEFALRLARLGKTVVLRRFTESRHGFTVRLIDQWADAQKLIIDTINGASAL